jgi:hypothetical protein
MKRSPQQQPTTGSNEGLPCTGRADPVAAERRPEAGGPEAAEGQAGGPDPALPEPRVATTAAARAAATSADGVHHPLNHTSPLGAGLWQPLLVLVFGGMLGRPSELALDASLC